MIVVAAVDASVKALMDAGVELSDFAKGNEKARERNNFKDMRR